ncbi:MAG: NarK/NasA family nitrate transporter [Lentisphaeria bacterium]|nr:MFS transporter [Lentisphaeria bacterium]NQZ67575.1 NarK/NasA family nitrate transporter [Lentisphaeria bacterium]
MTNTDINSSKSHRILGMNTLAFTISFMVWLMFGILITFLTKPIVVDSVLYADGFMPQLKGWTFLIISIPILTGSLFRLPIGILTDKYGGRPVYTIVLLISSVGAFSVAYVDTVAGFIIAGLIFGLAGTSFAVGIAYSSVWFSKEKQGLALGIFGAGNAGAALTSLLAPQLLGQLVGISGTVEQQVGGVLLNVPVVANPALWTRLPMVYACIIFITAIAFFFMTTNKISNASKTLAERLKPLKNIQVWRFGIYYFLLFGGFVALSLTLPNYYVEVYGLSLKNAGYLVCIFALLSAGFRAVGGWLTDRYGARSVMYATLLCTILLCAILCVKVTLPLFAVLTCLIGIVMGIGMAAVYKHIPNYFPGEVPVVGAMVGVIGGVGGFILPNLFKKTLELTGNYNSCWMLLTALSAISLVWMTVAIRGIKTKEKQSEITAPEQQII